MTGTIAFRRKATDRVMKWVFTLCALLVVLPLFLIFFDLVEIPAVFFLGIWFLMQLLSGVGSIGSTDASGGGTAFFAHIGGFVIGVVVGFALRMRSRARWDYQ